MSLHKNPGTTTDFVSDLPNEISEIIFLDLPPTTLLNCRKVSKSWKRILDNDVIWRSKFQDQKSWKYYNDDSETDSWFELYKERHLLELNWKNDKFTKHKLSGHSAEIHCVVFFRNWILTGSRDCTIRIWDNETFHCLRVLGKPNLDTKDTFTKTSLLELIEKNDDIFHFDSIIFMDINDKYLVFGSEDGSCIIWELPDFKPIDRLTVPTQTNYLILNGVELYNDYIVCCGTAYIGVWKSGLNNLEHRLQFDFQHRIEIEYWINGICIHNGIIYSRGYNKVRSWNIETGQMMQEFQFPFVIIHSFTANDEYLFVSDYDRIAVLDLQTNTTNVLSDGGPHRLFIVNNKIISVNNDSIIKIWNLSDLKLFKEFEILEKTQTNLHPPFSIGADSKMLAACTVECDVVIYDFTEKLRKKYLKHLV